MCFYDLNISMDIIPNQEIFIVEDHLKNNNIKPLLIIGGFNLYGREEVYEFNIFTKTKSLKEIENIKKTYHQPFMGYVKKYKKQKQSEKHDNI